MSTLDEYAADMARGLRTAVADTARRAVADIGNAYQDFLMADATVRPHHLVPGNVSLDLAHEAERAHIERTAPLHGPEPQHEPEIDAGPL